MWVLANALTALMVMAVASSKLGFGLACIRQNETASSMVGLNTTFYKSVAFGFRPVSLARRVAFMRHGCTISIPPTCSTSSIR